MLISRRNFVQVGSAVLAAIGLRRLPEHVRAVPETDDEVLDRLLSVPDDILIQGRTFYPERWHDVSHLSGTRAQIRHCVFDGSRMKAPHPYTDPRSVIYNAEDGFYFGGLFRQPGPADFSGWLVTHNTFMNWNGGIRM